MKPRLLVPSHNDVPQDVLGETDRALEFTGLLGRQRELEHAVMTVAVAGDLVGQAAPRRRGGLVDLASELGDRALKALAHRAEALLVGGGGYEVHELVGAHGHRCPFLGFAAGQWPGAKRRRGQKPRRYPSVYGMRARQASLCIRPGLASAP